MSLSKVANCLLLCVCLLFAMSGSIKADFQFFSSAENYDQAAGKTDLFLDFTGVDFEDSDNNGLSDVEGNLFSELVTYRSPDAGTSRVNIANINAGGIVNEIGPAFEWNGTLRWEYSQDVIATGFVGVDVEGSTVIRFFNDGNLIESLNVNSNGQTFQFLGYVGDTPFDAVELDGDFFAIGNHQSSFAIPEPTQALVLIGALLATTLKRKTRVR